LYNSVQLAFKYFLYYRKSANSAGHGIHSPFVYEFVRRVLNDTQSYISFQPIEKLRKTLQNDQSVVAINDHGAGSAMHTGMQRRIADIARHAAKRPAVAQLLFRIVKYFEPLTIIELGTSLGISAAYLSAASPAANLITIEGSPAVAAKARENLKTIQAENVEVITGTFDEQLPVVLDKIGQVDCVFIDGNHRKEPTLRYFNLALSKLSPTGFVILDDIHWSRDMEEAWDLVKQHPQVTCTIDLFFIGLVFFRKEFKAAQHFVIHYPYFFR
jgi:predicted O-methyltransferase YrrM